MEDLLVLFTFIIIAIAIGFIIGIFWINVSQKVYNRKLRKNAEKVLSGEKPNQFDLNGKIINVNKFIIKNDDDEEKIIDFKNFRKEK